MPTLHKSLSLLAILALSTLFGASIYDTVVFGPNLQAGGPEGLEHGRHFMVAATPAKLFRVLSPATQAFLLLCVIFFWRTPRLRWLFLGSLVAILACDAITFSYAYPRLRVLFASPLTTSAADLSRAANEWVACNYIRVALVLASWFACLAAIRNTAVAP
jgi:hypothetical protein